ncbi:MAG: DoxX family protein [Thermoanaerobaculia bacterium]|nr:DoxX family protein [Thermoanaerobaculia bacterium]
MRHPKLTRTAQGVAAMFLLIASVQKFIGDPGSIEIFSSLEMEPTGRYLIAVIELVAALLLLSPLAALGSLLVVGVMCGAIIAHVTQLGLVVNDDGGGLVGMLVVVLLCAGYVLISRRKELPLVGDTL